VKKFRKKIAALLGATMMFAEPLARAANVAPVPGDKILIIYNDDTAAGNGSYDLTIKNNILTALAAMGAAAPTVTTLDVPTTETNGIWTAMQGAGLSDFSAYCQVWDVRFDLPAGGGGSTSCTVPSYDTVSLGAGATTDQSLYTAFLNQGGHLLMVGDNYGYCSRNQNLVDFVNSVITSGTMGAPWYNFTQNETFNIISNAGPDNFQTNYANLGTLGAIGTDWPGQILIGGVGNQSGGGTVLVSQTGQPDANTYALALEWFANQLVGGSGKLVTIWDSNTIEEQKNNWEGYVQNLYTANSTCYNIQLTKSVSPGTVTECQQATYTLCYDNIGTRAVVGAQVWDTFSTCLSPNAGDSTAWASQAGNVYTWNLGTVNGGTNQCVTVVVDILQMPPCP
jgi:hypothetical protein